MARKLAAATLLVLALLGATFFGWSRSQHRTGFAAPDFALSDLNGVRHQLSMYRGKVVFLNIWATWCPPCREEMPSMQRLWERFRGKDFVMLAVSEDAGGATVVERFAREIGLTFPILLDADGGLPEHYSVTGFPETFIIDRSGKIIRHVVGPAEWDSPEAIEFLAGVLAS